MRIMLLKDSRQLRLQIVLEKLETYMQKRMRHYPVANRLPVLRLGLNQFSFGNEYTDHKISLLELFHLVFQWYNVEFKFVFWLRKNFRLVVFRALWLWSTDKSSWSRCRSWTWTWWLSIRRVVVSRKLSNSRVGSRKRTVTILFEGRKMRRSRMSSSL